MKKVLVFLEYYLPGFKSGGPLQTMKNIVDNLGDEVDFYIVTRDRDLGEETCYKGVEVGTWQQVGRANVLYLPPEHLGTFEIKKLMDERKYDVIYLNSFFSLWFSIIPVFIRRLQKTTCKFIVAPRGEFSEGALNIKPLKKHLYLSFAKLTKLYSDVIFHASTSLEKSDIERVVGPHKGIMVAKDLPEISLPDLTDVNDSLREERRLEICFISRLVPKKNLDYAIEILKSCRVPINFTIYGSKEDHEYWRICERLLTALPNNVSWTYGGELMPDDVKKAFSAFDIFLFPTRGENYGHVIAESLLSGTFVLISDQTPWGSVEVEGLGRAISLTDPDEFVREIEAWFAVPVIERQKRKLEIQRKAMPLVIDDRDVMDNRVLFTE